MPFFSNSDVTWTLTATSMQHVVTSSPTHSHWRTSNCPSWERPFVILEISRDWSNKTVLLWLNTLWGENFDARFRKLAEALYNGSAHFAAVSVARCWNKKKPKFFKKLPIKNLQQFLLKKVMTFKSAQKGTKYWGYFWKKKYQI